MKQHSSFMLIHTQVRFNDVISWSRRNGHRVQEITGFLRFQEITWFCTAHGTRVFKFQQYFMISHYMSWMLPKISYFFWKFEQFSQNLRKSSETLLSTEICDSLAFGVILSRKNQKKRWILEWCNAETWWRFYRFAIGQCTGLSSCAGYELFAGSTPAIGIILTWSGRLTTCGQIMLVLVCKQEFVCSLSGPAAISGDVSQSICG